MEYMIETAGEDHVGLGFDFNMYLGSFGAVGLEDCTCIPNVTKELVNLGYNEATIYKILGGNFMRVLENILP
jgi:membrane dipeptidase